MKVDLLEVFETHVTRWYEAWAEKTQREHPGTRMSLEMFLAQVRKLPTYVRLRLGLALHRKRLSASTVPGRGFDVGNDEHKTYMLTRRPLKDGGSEVAPCWEMFVHLAEYASLEAMTRIYDLDVRIEDNYMDLTVRAGAELIAYVEVKGGAKQGQSLVSALERLNGKPVPETTKKDAERKANYILDAAPSRPVAFSVRAANSDGDGVFEKTWTATARGRILDLEPESNGDPVPLRVELDRLQEPRARGLACLVWTLEREAPVVVDRGKHGSYLLYEARDGQTPVVIGTERNLGLYTVLDGFSAERLERFDRCLREFGTCLGEEPTPKGSRVWTNSDGSGRTFLDDEDRARQLGRRLAEVLRAGG